MTTNRAHASLIGHLHTFCLNQLLHYEDGLRDFNSFRKEGFIIDEEPVKGDLVQLSAAPMSKWQLSWYHSYNPEKDEHLLESIEDGTLCNWANVGLNVFTRETVKNNPQWRWTNKQFEFSDKWRKALKAEDAYIYLNNGISFSDDQSKALVSLRVRFNITEKTVEAEISNWKKVTIKSLRETYLWLAEQLKAKEDT